MIKYFCDKCDKELENYDIFTVTVTPPEIRRWDDDARTGDCILCRECLDAFQGWLEIRKMKKMTEEEIDWEIAQDWTERARKKNDRIIGEGYAERQIADTLSKVEKIKTEL